MSLNDLPELRCKRLILRNPTRLDIDAICALANDWEVVRRLSRLPFPYTRADAIVFLEQIVPNEAAWIIQHLDNSETLGVIGLSPHEDSGTVEFGYWLGRKYWYNGFATEAGQAVLEYAFETMSLPKVISGCFVDNTRSGRVLEKLGFTKTRQSVRSCMAEAKELPHFEMLLTREVWRSINRRV